MALKKEITLDNGVTVNYHRIVSINKIINICNTIEVASYTGDNKREEEKKAIKNGNKMNVFIHTQYLNTEYNPTNNIDEIYNYLKTLDQFKDAIDC